MNEYIKRIERATKRYGRFRTLELIIGQSWDSINPALAINHWHLRRSCTKLGKGITINGKVDLMISSNGRLIIGDHAWLNCPIQLRVLDDAEISIGKNCFFDGYVSLYSGSNGSIKLGDDVYVGNFSSITSFKQIAIGAHTFISGNVLIVDFDHGTKKDMLIKKQELEVKPVEIGEDVWIGWGAMILKGNKIGDGAVIGAGSVVTKDVAPYTVVAGVPARKIKIRE